MHEANKIQVVGCVVKTKSCSFFALWISRDIHHDWWRETLISSGKKEILRVLFREIDFGRRPLVY